jgi:hypothetical protein
LPELFYQRLHVSHESFSGDKRWRDHVQKTATDTAHAAAG